MAWYEKVEDENATVWTELQTDDGLTYYYNTETKETSWDRPDELMTEDDKTMQGEWVWLPDEIECFKPGKVTTRTNDITNVESEDGEVHKIKNNVTLEPLKWSSLQRITPDLVLLDSMSSPLILHNLKKRFESGNIYTNIGTICISINPYAFVDPPIYGADVITKYRLKLGDHKQMPPHVYCIGDNAYKGLTFPSNPNQSIVISGESGAGKTEAAKQVVNYVSSVAGSVSGIENFLFVCNPILESFGNAKTVRNNNSSRFGKYMELYFNKELKLYSAFITNYLLEKIRVPKPMENERNYHIFYQICYGNKEIISEFNLSAPDNFYYLTRGNCTTVDGINDESEFKDTINAFKELNFTKDQVHDMFQTLAAILHMGNVTVKSSGNSVEIVSDESFKNASRLFGVTEKELKYRLTTRKMRIRNQEPIDVPLKPLEASDAKDACAKFIYSNLFDWIVAKLNKEMNTSSNKYKSIGILDIFGFEIFKQNSFEQLCINYTNEHLQQIFNLTVFKREEQLYKSENVQFSHIPFIDNEPIIKVIEDIPYGILNLLDEECKIPDGKEEKFLVKLGDAFKTNKSFNIESRGGGKVFTLKHYAGPVNYCIDNFMEKNKDTLTQDLLDMVTQSKFTFLASLFPKSDDESDKKRKATLGKQFKQNLNNLIKTLKETEPHYIRCIKPNEEKAPFKFVSKNCNEQLTYAGVFEAVQIRKAGYPFHQKHSEFVKRYGFLCGPNVQSNTSGCKQIISTFKLDEENIKVGRTMVLYRSNEHRLLELKRSIAIEKRDLEENLKNILNKDPSSMENPEPYFEDLAMLVRKAKRFKMESSTSQQAEKRLEAFIEARIDPQTKALMQQAFESVDYDKLTHAVGVADQNNYQTKMCKNCRKLLAYIKMIRRELDKALDIVDRKALEVCVKASDMCKYKYDKVEEARRLMALEKEKFVAEQIKAAVRKKDLNRTIRLEIILKELMFEKNSMFEVQQFGMIKSADDWSREKMFGREKLRMGFLTWQNTPIHSSLTDYGKKKDAKNTNKEAVSMFKDIQVFMGDRKPAKNQHFNKDVAINILKKCVSNPNLKNEFYLQLIKQLKNNPNNGSAKKGYDLMILGLNTFGPDVNFENHLYYFLYKNVPSSEKQRFLTALQTMMLQPNKKLEVPSKTQFDEIVSGKNMLQPQFTDKSPPSVPTWENLLKNWDEQEEDDEEVLFVASTNKNIQRRTSTNVPMPKNTTLNKPVEPQEKVTGWGVPKTRDVAPNPEPVVAEYNGPWVEYIDPESGYPYYFNTETEETTWDKPEGMP